MTATGLLTSTNHRVEITYSVGSPIPSDNLATTHTFEWAAYIDDSNNIFTVGLTADFNLLKYFARIQSSVRPEDIELIRGTQGKFLADGQNATLPGFVAPPFRNFAADPNLVVDRYGAHKQSVTNYWGVTIP
jgi:hypothetical protein